MNPKQSADEKSFRIDARKIVAGVELQILSGSRSCDRSDLFLRKTEVVLTATYFL
jgi:hypothetical protein